MANLGTPDLIAIQAACRNPAAIILLAVMLRCCVGLFPHSGQGTPPMFGDYEAQRHWMEITYNLHPREWYFNTSNNDLLYWGLDYPPLTAYVSYAFGVIASIFQPGLVSLFTSRGFDTVSSRSFMRLTVVICDILIYLPSIWLVCANLYSRQDKSKNKKHSSKRDLQVLTLRLLYKREQVLDGGKVKSGDVEPRGLDAIAFVNEVILIILLQPSLMLIDHGHFQYNCVSLGLAAWAVYFMQKKRYVLGSFAFCLSLNFKQIALYYSPSFFFYLLSLCFRNTNGSFLKGFTRVFVLGITVIVTFGLLWFPFCYAGDPTMPCEPNVITGCGFASCGASMLQVIRRLFPFNRGLFEDKVANIWCSLSPVLKLRQLVPADRLLSIATGCTCISLLPSALDLLVRKPNPRRLLWSMFNISLGFFLFSYQVHEKSILFPLLPASLLIGEAPGPMVWFSVVAVFSMTPLLFRDQLLIPYFATTTMFVVASFISFNTELFYAPMPWIQRVGNERVSGLKIVSIKFLIAISLLGMWVIHACMAFVPPPAHLPDLWVLMLSAYSCAHFIIALIYGNWVQLTLPAEVVEVSPKRKVE